MHKIPAGRMQNQPEALLVPLVLLIGAEAVLHHPTCCMTLQKCRLAFLSPLLPNCAEKRLPGQCFGTPGLSLHLSKRSGPLNTCTAPGTSTKRVQKAMPTKCAVKVPVPLGRGGKQAMESKGWCMACTFIYIQPGAVAALQRDVLALGGGGGKASSRQNPRRRSDGASWR